MKYEKCNEKCEVYSRVTGYFRPVANWNKGKQEEFRDRKVFKVGATVAMVFALGLAAGGCKAVNTLAQGVAEKSLSGSGTVSIQRVGVDPETNTPVLKSTVVTGDYASARNGDHALQYRRRKSPSIWNKDAVEEEVTINCVGSKEYADRALELARKDAETTKKAPAATEAAESAQNPLE